MSKYLPVSLGIATFFFASIACAIERTELEKSSIKAATDCVAQAALKNPDIITLHRQNRLNEITDWIVLRSNVCDKPLTAMRLLHDQIYGKGSGRLFLQGRFLADLPRAVGERIGIELANRALQSPEISGSFGRAYPGPYDRGQWNHNGSLMTLVEGENNSRAIYYHFPRPTMTDIGVREGTLLFRGYETDGRWFGIAYVFKSGVRQFRIVLREIHIRMIAVAGQCIFEDQHLRNILDAIQSVTRGPIIPIWFSSI
jgi:hypothetical protein